MTRPAHLWRQARNQLSAWLPALMMLVFALATFWLLRSAPQLGQATPERPATHDPDYTMREFSVRSFDPEGRLKSSSPGDEGRHYPDTDTLQVSAPRMRSIDAEGHPTLATARRAESNGDGSQVRLYDDARVLRDPIAKPGGRPTPRMEFRGDYLLAYTEEDRVSSDQPVELLRGADRFTGDTFDYDDNTGVAHLKGRVRGVIQPKK